MIVVDASALVDWLLDAPRAGQVVGRLLRGERAHTLDFATLEVMAAFRRACARGRLSAVRAELALVDLAIAPIRRHPIALLADRAWALRNALTPYDAAYVALAESLESPLVTTDRRLARAHGHRAVIIDASR